VFIISACLLEITLKVIKKTLIIVFKKKNSRSLVREWVNCYKKYSTVIPSSD